MIFNISHRTSYRYGTPVAQSQHVVHLAPRAFDGQTVIRHSLLIDPAPMTRTDFIDYFGNPATILVVEEEHHELIVHARSTIDVRPPSPVVLADSLAWEQIATSASSMAFWGNDGLDLDVLQYTCVSRQTPTSQDILDYAMPSFPPGRPILEGAWDLTTRIHADFTFDPTATDVSTPISTVLQERRGVCQDFAHLSIACLRALGLPARYVSGYLLTRPPPGKPKLVGADASHAWLSVWAPGTGWLDLDPTNGLIPHGEHIVVAYGRDFDDVSPISGVLLGGSGQSLSIAVDVAAVE